MGRSRGERERNRNSRDTTTIFVTEFDDKWRAWDLFFEFKELGDIGEVIIPPKRDRRGRRYGFVRFINVEDVKRLATKMDNVIL